MTGGPRNHRPGSIMRNSKAVTQRNVTKANHLTNTVFRSMAEGANVDRRKVQGTAPPVLSKIPDTTWDRTAKRLAKGLGDSAKESKHSHQYPNEVGDLSEPITQILFDPYPNLQAELQYASSLTKIKASIEMLKKPYLERFGRLPTALTKETIDKERDTLHREWSVLDQMVQNIRKSCAPPEGQPSLGVKKNLETYCEKSYQVSIDGDKAYLHDKDSIVYGKAGSHSISFKKLDANNHKADTISKTLRTA